MPEELPGRVFGPLRPHIYKWPDGFHTIVFQSGCEVDCAPYEMIFMRLVQEAYDRQRSAILVRDTRIVRGR